MSYILRPYTSDELDSLWNRWANNPDPDLTIDEIDRLFETIWHMEMEGKPALTPPPPLAPPEEMP